MISTAIKKADVLIEALPYIKNFRDKIFVIKYGGSILSEGSIRASVLEDIVFLHFMGIDVVLVHGGGPNITEKLKTLNIPSEFFEGIRVTSADTLKVVEGELRELNQMLVREIAAHNAESVGLEGKDNIVFAQKKIAAKDLGFVGEVIKVDAERLKSLVRKNHIVILSPSGVNKQSGEVYNINADEVAASVAGALTAEKFLFLTDVKGVMRNVADEASLISSMKQDEVKKLIDEGIISKGMIPKVLACTQALDKGVKKVHIVDAKTPHAILLEIFTDRGIGTEITK
jgi:acetylglutamate kinase